MQFAKEIQQIFCHIFQMKSNETRTKLKTIKFNNLSKDQRHEHSHCVSSSYQNLTQKFKKTESIKVSSRGFNKSLYTKLSAKIIEKPVSFYQYGLNHEQKKVSHHVFHEIFDAPRNMLKGTISIGELWDRKTNIKYLKQNKMFYNKKFLMKEFENLNKERQMKKKQLAIKNDQAFIENYKKLLKQHRCSKSQQKCIPQGQNPLKLFTNIQKSLKDISQTKQSNKVVGDRKILRELEKNIDVFSEIDQKFRQNMILLL